jgi:hypothetical protein
VGSGWPPLARCGAGEKSSDLRAKIVHYFKALP